MHPGLGATVAINTGTTPDEIGIQFTLPFPVRCAGIVFYNAVGATADYDAILYDSDGTTALATASVDATIRGATGAVAFRKWFATPQVLAANKTYYAAIKPTTANSITVRYLVLTSAAHMEQYPGGTSFVMAERTDGGAWTVTTTQRPAISLECDMLPRDLHTIGL
jgi:hypothetical protein